MIDYSEKQLLMLSNFVYLPASKSDMTIDEVLKQYEAPGGEFTAESVQNAGTGGGLDADQVSQLFTEMKQECRKNQDFAQLSPARRLEESDVRGICYTNSKNENPVIVFRGTGGTKEAWQDNMYGGFTTDTRIQKTANDFVKYECGVFSDCVVTGHSKGGNLSQYVTVMNGDKISRCVSFDGQGMNNEFIANNAELVANASGKIKSICAYNDFVSILLTCIAGEVVYVKNNGSGIDGHSSLYMLTSNEYDENGNFISTKKQSPITGAMGSVTDKIVSTMGIMDETDNLLIGGILGEAIASLTASDNVENTSESIKRAINESMLLFSLKMKSLFDNPNEDIRSLPSGGVYFDYFGIRKIVDMYGDDINDTQRILARTDEIRGSIDMDIATRFYTDIALSRIVEQLIKIRAGFETLEMIMCESTGLYLKHEETISARMQSNEN